MQNRWAFLSCYTERPIIQTSVFIFDIQLSVHLKYNSKLQPKSCNVPWFIYFYRRSTCFRQFLRPSSGAHKCKTASGIVKQCCCWQQYCLTICTVMCSWWWAEEPPETCTASVEINKSRNVASWWLWFGIICLHIQFQSKLPVLPEVMLTNFARCPIL